jgi:hypothetical protein
MRPDIKKLMQNGGSRTLAAASNHHAAQLVSCQTCGWASLMDSGAGLPDAVSEHLRMA